MDRATVTATSQPLRFYIEGQGVDGRVLGPAPQFLDTLTLVDIKNADQGALFGSCGHLISVRAQHERAER